MPRNAEPLFEIDEVALCLYPPLYYDAKVLKHRISKDGSEHQYYIHYLRWSEEWDEWVSEQQLIKVNEENLQRQADAKKKLDEETTSEDDDEPKPKKKRNNVKTIKKKKPKVARHSKEARDAAKRVEDQPKTVETLESNSFQAVESNGSELEVPNSSAPIDTRIEIPSSLQYWLQKDYLFVNRGADLYNLPAEVTIKEAIDEFKKESPDDEVLLDVIKSLEDFFETNLESLLLYESERSQYEDAALLERPLVEVYGAFHLLRMFARLNFILPSLSMCIDSKITLVQCARNFLEYLDKNEAKYFSEDSFTTYA